jgi:hypothetical protein
MGRDGTGCDATGRVAIGCNGDGDGDEMGRDGMALSHSNAWQGTASAVYMTCVLSHILFYV